jgi:YHS domain-containing protein
MHGVRAPRGRHPRGGTELAGERADGGVEPPRGGKMATDIVCGSEVDPTRSVELVYAGRAYYFCSEECRRDFADAPEDYLERARLDAS